MNHMALIRKAAHGRDLKLVGRSVVFNRSAEALQQLGVSILPDIEEFLSKEFRSDVRADAMEGHPWMGLANLFQVYFEVGCDSRYADMGDFVLSLHGWLREEAVRNLYLIWGPQEAREEQVLPANLRHAVERLAASGSELEREFAKRLLRHQGGNKRASTRSLVSTKK
jgi:hypothetical protein